MSSWWEALYDHLLADVLLVRDDPADTDRTLRYLTEQLRLTPGCRVFDQCCGIASLAIPLARAGHQVVGVDQAGIYIERGRADAARAGVAVELHTGDAFEFVPSAPVRGVFNWWTSFGYALDDAQNARMLARAFEALEPGGRFALDVMNLPGVLRAFAPTVVTERDTPAGRVRLVRESRLDLALGAMHKRWTYHLPDGRTVEHDSTVRLHLPHTIAELMRGVGFTDLVLHGELDGSPLTLDSRRCILIATRPRHER